ncbi:MAG: hypothetical protein E1N59_2704 [Puniceicoccaceae bacterium 5H]|nr:MAG: hypothetical protein E1N59_2704 [Puniceicoccaceae bacterium 5H]
MLAATEPRFVKKVALPSAKNHRQISILAQDFRASMLKTVAAE